LVHKGEQYSEKLWHMPTKDLLYVTLDGRHQMAFFNDKKFLEYEQAVGKIFSTPKQLKWVEKAYKQYGTALLNSSRVLEKDLSQKSFDTFLKDYAILTNGLWLTLIAGRHFHKLLLDNLASLYPKLSKAELDSLAGCLTYPYQHTPLTESQISLFKIGAAIQKNISKAQVENLIQKHLKIYGVIPVNYNEDPWTRADIEKQLKNLLKSDCLAAIKSLKVSHKKKVLAAQKALKRLSSARVKHFAQLLQSVTLLNEYRKFVFCNASLAHQDIFRRIAKTYKLKDWRECLKFTADEIKHLYFQDDPGPLTELKNRKAVGLLYDSKSKKTEILTKNKIKLFVDAMNPDKSASVVKDKTVSGSIANPGVAIGKAKIILGKPDFYKFNTGDILIAPMTSVDFVPLMQRAAAFVTNEGGITSHASIVSREMNKPCIIGTKIATKVFKDGDLVEVDANKGIVKIIKK
jgi:phosphohistidine swiveling domain-containing protein